MMSKRLTKRLAIFNSFSSSKQEGKDFDQLVNQDGGEKIAPKAACGIKRARRLIRLLNPESFIIVPFGSFQLIKTSRFDIIIQSYCRPLFIEWTIEYRSSLSSPCLFNSVIWRSLRRHRHSFIIIPSTFNRKCRHESKGKWKKKLANHIGRIDTRAWNIDKVKKWIRVRRFWIPTCHPINQPACIKCHFKFFFLCVDRLTMMTSFIERGKQPMRTIQ